MRKREWDAKSNGKLPHLFIPSKIATEVLEFAMEDLPLDRIAALVPEFPVKDLPLGRTLMMMMMYHFIIVISSYISTFLQCWNWYAMILIIPYRVRNL